MAQTGQQQLINIKSKQFFMILLTILIMVFSGASTQENHSVEFKDDKGYEVFAKSYLIKLAGYAEEYYFENDTYGGFFESTFSSNRFSPPTNVTVSVTEITTNSYVISAKHYFNNNAPIYCISNSSGIFKDDGKGCKQRKIVCHGYFDTATRNFLWYVSLKAELYFHENLTYEGAFDNISSYGSSYAVDIPANVTFNIEEVGSVSGYLYSATHSDPSASTFYVSPDTGIYKTSAKGC